MASITRINVHPHYRAQDVKYYRLPDGKMVGGINATEVVQAMSDEKMSTPRSLATYRRAVGRRLHESFPELEVSTNNNVQFVRSLVACGQLTEL